jgi:hypothetical protein
MHVAASGLAALARGSFIRSQISKVNATKLGTVAGNWSGMQIPRQISADGGDGEPEVREAVQSTVSSWQGMAHRSRDGQPPVPNEGESTPGRRRRPLPPIITPPLSGAEFDGTVRRPTVGAGGGGNSGGGVVVKPITAGFQGFVRETGDDDMGGSFLPPGSMQAGPAPRAVIQSQAAINTDLGFTGQHHHHHQQQQQQQQHGITAPTPPVYRPAGMRPSLSADVFDGSSPAPLISQRGEALRGSVMGMGPLPMMSVRPQSNGPPSQGRSDGGMGMYNGAAINPLSVSQSSVNF